MPDKAIPCLLPKQLYCRRVLGSDSALESDAALGILQTPLGASIE
jgi:hypothetical protein